MPRPSLWHRHLCRLEDRITPSVKPIFDEIVAAVRSDRGPGVLPADLSPFASVSMLLHVDSTGESLFHLRLASAQNPGSTLAAVAAHPEISWAEFNAYFEGDPREFIPNDPQYSKQYHHPLMQNQKAWDHAFGEGMLVAVTDDGVDYNHEDLVNNIWVNPGEIAGNGKDDDGNGYIDDINGWDFSSDDNNPMPPSGQNHGTHVAGIVAARIDNGVGVSGTAGKATIQPIRFYGSGSWTATVILNSYKYATDNGAKIITTSYNIDGFADNDTFRSAVQYAYDNGVLHFNSAGNNSLLNPPRQVYDQMLFVASTTGTDARSSFSNFGTGIDISAPGSDILATYPNNAYQSISGTSMATPNAAAAAALIWSYNPDWTREQVVAKLVNLADNIDAQNPSFAGLLGGGRANPYRAITGVMPAPRIGGIEEVPTDGLRLFTAPTALTVRLPQKLSAASVTNLGNWKLVRAGDDDLFGTADDVTIPLTPSYKTQSPTFQVGSNQIRFGVPTLTPGRYRFTGISGGLEDPFGNALDGNGDGKSGGDFVRDFIISGAGKVIGHGPVGIAQAPVSALTIQFAAPMSAASFQVVDDVISFTGPNGNLTPAITGHTWTDTKTLRINFQPVGTVGTYSMVLGPEIISTFGLPLDNNGNGVAGEPLADRYTATFSITPAPALTYVFQQHPYDAGLDLVPGAAGVVTIDSLSSGDDAFASIPLGANTFRYYFKSYSGSNNLFVSTNGLLTFGSGTTAYVNTDLTSSPSEAAIAPFWDDLLTNRNTAPDDLILYQFRSSKGAGPIDQLVVEWNEVRHFSGSMTNGATFQAIINLNTGTTPGDIIFNYRDIDFGSSSFNNGASASIGIKDAGTQGPNRLLVSQNTGSNPLVQTGKAIRISTKLNTAPIALPGGPYSVSQGKSVTLNGSAIDPDEPASYLLYRWDLDGDGNFGETGAAAKRGDEIGPAPTFDATGLAPGVYPIQLRVRDSAGVEHTAATAVEVLGPPQVTNLIVNDGADQRSRVTDLSVEFSAAVTLKAAGSQEAFQLARTGPGGVQQPVPFTVTWSPSSTAATSARLSFAPLIDGNYRLSLNPSALVGTVSQLEILAYSTPMAPTAGSIHRLFGDWNGDRTVNFGDFLAFRSSFGLASKDAGFEPAFDFDEDGQISFSDYLEFRARFGTTLAGD